jgi:hypothetical protein
MTMRHRTDRNMEVHTYGEQNARSNGLMIEEGHDEKRDVCTASQFVIRQDSQNISKKDVQGN